MGNTNQNTIKSQTILQKYEFTNIISQDKKVYKNKQNHKQYLVVERTFPTNQMMIQYQKSKNKIISIQHPYYLNQTEHAIMTVSTICSLQHKVMHFFQYYSNTLQSELRRRQQNQQYFQQKEIWSILCSCVLVMSYLTKNDITNLCVHPQNIIIDQSGMIKIISPLLCENNDQIINQQFYYSPQHLKSLSNNNFNTLNNKSSVFTLGITLMNIVLLQSMTDIYEYSNNTIKIELLNSKLSRIQSVQMKQIIKKMLIIPTYDRISFTQLEEMLYNILENTHIQHQHQHQYQNKHQDQNQDKHQYNIITNNLNNSKRKHTNKNINNINNNNINKNNHKQQYQKLKQSIYQIGTSSIHKQQTFLPFDSFRNIQNYHIKCSKNDEEDIPSIFNQKSENDKAKVDQEDILVVNLLIRQNSTKRLQSSTLNQTASILINQQSISRISNLNSQTQRMALQQINHKNWLKVQNKNSSQVSLNQTNKINKTNQSLKSLGSSKLSKISFQQSNLPYHTRQQLNRGVYQGYKLNKMRQGYGVFTYAEGGKYDGQWKMNKMQGRGALYYANEKIAYEGQWNDDKLNGYGTLYNEQPTYFHEKFDFRNLHLTDNNWVKYQGNFIDDLKNGQGTLFLANGQYYRGYFKDDFPHGNGIYRGLNGIIIKGNWILGILQGN